ncbi:MAG TPA: PIN domain-containing protein [Thermoanaerobaculia bacterium]|nr:PIN domain-containing protein [Thermoanaerobaculia bacterium]
MKLTFVDASILIAAARGGNVQAARAMDILDDADREFAASTFLRLEVLPQAAFNKREAEVAFYDAFFSSVQRWATNLDAVIEIAMREASVYGIQAMDALHIAAAVTVGASELITAEKHSRSIHRTRSIKVITIHPERIEGR